MKAFCEHHQPWFKCGVCAQARCDAASLAEMLDADGEFLLRRLMAFGTWDRSKVMCRLDE